jgi:glycosyltransferase involved in cell wall biosynthesis
MSIDFSVILPTRGLCRFLPETIASVLEGPQGMELLLVHDRREGEGDLDPSLVADGRIRVMQPAAAGVSNARNMAMDEASGRFIAFVDDDDVWLPGHLEAGAKLLDRYPTAAIGGSNAHLLQGAQAQLPKRERLGELPLLLPERESGPVPLHDLLLVNWFHPSTVMLRRELLTFADRFDPQLAYMEDYEFWLRLGQRGAVFDPRADVVIRRYGENVSANRRRMAEGSLHVLEQFLGTAPAAETITRGELKRREGRLWHDLAYACLIEDDVPCARRAAAQAIRRLPAMPKNYAYYLACWLPGVMRQALVHRGRRTL